MTGIAMNGEFLDLPPGVVLEIIRNSPYINNDAIDGEYSLPVALPYTDKNYRLIAYSGNHYKTHAKQTLDAELYADGIIYIGKFVVDGFSKNNNQPVSQVSNGLFVFSISDFFQEVKDKKLSDLTLGGIRTFNFTTTDPYDGSGGFWQHVLSVAQTPGEYTFVPIKNEGWGGLIDNSNNPVFTWMNRLDNSGHSVPYFSTSHNVASLCPAINLKYLIEKCFTENNWTIDGEVLLDDLFLKLFSQSFNAIYWANWTEVTGTIGSVIPKSTVSFSLKEHVPPDYTIRNFILDIKNRYGIGFVFDSNKKVCTLKWLKNIIANGTGRDLSNYAQAPSIGKFDSKERIISLIQNKDSSDSFPSYFDVTKVTPLTPVVDFDALPAASGQNEGDYCFVYAENAWFELVNIDAVKSWQRIGDNLQDYLLPEQTEGITTGITTFAMQRQIFRVYLSNSYIGLFPICYQPGSWVQSGTTANWSLRTLFCFGYKPDRQVGGSSTGACQYPFSHCFPVDNYNNSLGLWANVYKDYYNTTDKGLYENFWKVWIAMYKSTDLRNYIFNLPLYILHDLKWEDVVTIHSVRFLIKSIKYNIPYNGKTELELLKID